MEIIRKKICLDDYLSHNSGVMPYISLDEDGTNINYVFGDNYNGNYRNFACDFLLVSQETSRYDASGKTIESGRTVSSGETVYVSKKYNRFFPTGKYFLNGRQIYANEISGNTIYYSDSAKTQEICNCKDAQELSVEYRLRYLDILRIYNEIKKELNHGLYLKRYNFNDYSYSSGITGNCGKSALVLTSKEYYWSENTDEKILYDFIVCSKSDFTIDSNGKYISSGHSSEKYIVLIDNYDILEKFIKTTFTYFWESGDTSYFKSFFDCDIPSKIMDYVEFFDRYILGKIIVYEESGDTKVKINGPKVPNYVYNSNLSEYLKLMKKLKEGKEIDKRSKFEYENYGGENFEKFLDKYSSDLKWLKRVSPKEGKYLCYGVPTIDIPISFEQECSLGYIYTPYEYSLSGNGDLIVEDYEVPISSITYTETSGHAESKLETLYSEKAIKFSDNIYGIPVEEENGGQVYKVTYSKGNWSSVVGTNNVKCSDGEGELPPANSTKYHNIPFTACMYSYNEYVEENWKGTWCYMRSKYKNDASNPIGIPFESGVPMNIQTFDDGTVSYDEITDISISGGIITFEYVIGATSGATELTGVHYKESFSYYSAMTYETIDNFYYNVPVYYNKIDFDSKSKSIYSEDYRIYRSGRTAEITSIQVTKPYCNKNVMFFTRESVEGLQNDPKYGLSITFDRGNAAAWENHFKLSECNTMEDLENYGNNFFNLDEENE